MRNFSLIFLSLILMALGCDNTPIPEPGDSCLDSSQLPSAPFSNPVSKVWIVNEGNFQWGNASLDWYAPATKQYSAGVFDSVNQEILGDVFQSISFFDQQAYLVINNSGKIEIVSTTTGQKSGTIQGLTSPRYFLPVSKNKAYVSDLYAGSVAIIDLATNEVTGSIPLPGWTEEMRMINSKVAVTNVSSSYLYILDPITDLVHDSVRISIGGNNLEIDHTGQLWVSCSADLQTNRPGAFHRIDPMTWTVTKTIHFPDGTGPSDIEMSADGTVLYYLDTDLYAINIEADSLPECPVVSAEGGLFYGLGIDPNNGDIYVADAIDYVQRGVILRYNKSGESLDEWRGGVIPAAFGFE